MQEEGKFEIGKDDVASLARNERMSVAAPEMRNMRKQNSCRAWTDCKFVNCCRLWD